MEAHREKIGNRGEKYENREGSREFVWLNNLIFI
jgi:hypothetical protein